MTNLSQKNGYSPRTNNMHSLSFITFNSSTVISSRPSIPSFSDVEPFLPLVLLRERVSIVSFPSVFETCSRVVGSCPPRNSRLSQFPRTFSQLSLYIFFSCERFCIMTFADISIERIVASNSSKRGIVPTLANSSNKHRT